MYVTIADEENKLLSLVNGKEKKSTFTFTMSEKKMKH